jgi:hypothetical protein
MATIVEESAALVVSIVPPSCPCIENYDSSELYITQAMKVISIADPDRCTRNSSVFKVDGLVLGEGSKEHQICNCILCLFFWFLVLAWKPWLSALVLSAIFLQLCGVQGLLKPCN